MTTLVSFGKIKIDI